MLVVAGHLSRPTHVGKRQNCEENLGIDMEQETERDCGGVAEILG